MPTRQIEPNLETLNHVSRERWAVTAAVAIVKVCDFADQQMGAPANTAITELIRQGPRKFVSSPAAVTMRRAQDFTETNMRAIFDTIVTLAQTGIDVKT